MNANSAWRTKEATAMWKQDYSDPVLHLPDHILLHVLKRHVCVEDCIRSNNASILKSAQHVRLMERRYQNKYVEWIYTGIMSRARRRMKE